MKKNILITGCSKGLGKNMAKKFNEHGHNVIHHLGRTHYDLSNIEELFNLVLHAKKNNVNMLINNAAITCPSLPFKEYNMSVILNMLDVNLKAPILLTYFLLDHLENIININSMVGLEVKKPRTLYSATKWGLRGFSNSLKAENKKIKILDVYPTNIKTTPDRQNAMDIDMVVDKIYQSYLNGEEELILDGRVA